MFTFLSTVILYNQSYVYPAETLQETFLHCACLICWVIHRRKEIKVYSFYFQAENPFYYLVCFYFNYLNKTIFYSLGGAWTRN